MRKILSILLSVCLLFGVAASFSACATRGAPKVEDIYDRVVSLVEASHELNTIFYGEGLPVYAADSEYADFTHLYFGFTYRDEYEMATPYAAFGSSVEIKNAAEKVYSTAILESTIYPSAFDGYALDDGTGDSMFAYSRFYEEDGWIYQSAAEESYFSGIRVYDYSTMRVVAPSNSSACYVEIDTWLEHDPATILTQTLRLVRQDDGLWYLDSFTM